MNDNAKPATIPVSALVDPRFLAIREAIRQWFIHVPGSGELRKTTDEDAHAIYAALTRQDPDLAERLRRIEAAQESLARVYQNSVSPKLAEIAGAVQRLMLPQQPREEPEPVSALPTPNIAGALGRETS